jgi:hypothetical protein
MAVGIDANRSDDFFVELQVSAVDIEITRQFICIVLIDVMIKLYLSEHTEYAQDDPT